MTVITRPGGAPTVVRFTSNSKHLIAGPTAVDGKYCLTFYDVLSGAPARQVANPLGPNGAFERIEVSPDGKFLAAGAGNFLYIFNIDSLDVYSLINEPRLGCFLFGDEGASIYLSSTIPPMENTKSLDGIRRYIGAINIRKLDGALIRQIIDGDSPIQQICLNQSKDRIYVGRSELGITGPDANLLKRSDDNRLIAMSIVSGKNLLSFRENLWRVEYLSYSSTKNLLSSSSQDGYVRLWNPDNGQVYAEVDYDYRGGYPIAFSPNGDLFAYCTRSSLKVVSLMGSGRE